jgi:hypothetical protein
MEMASLCILTGFNDGLETRLAPMSAGVVSPDLKLSDCEAQKVKPYWAILFEEGVADVGLTRFEP